MDTIMEIIMQKKVRQALFNSVIAALFLSACNLQATPTAPPVDIAGTVAVQLAFQMQTQTVAAYTPTAPPTPSAPPTLAATETPPAPSATSIPVVIVDKAPCYAKPGGVLTSNINAPKKVKLLGVGSVPGWYVILNPYFYSPCWIKAENLRLESDFDLSAYPTITP
jgi:hypothetical protein